MKPVVAFLREKGMRLIIYLDDILVMCECQEELTRQVILIQDLFSVLGLTINSKKSQLSPVQELVFLGHQISTAQMRIVLPWEKIQKICGKATHLAQKSMVTIRELAAFVGMTNAAKQGIPIAPLFHCHIQALINRVVAQAEQREVKQQYQRMVVLTPEAQAELLWWARTAKTYNSSPLIQSPPDLVIKTDASLLGWGARCQELRTVGLWSVEEQMMHINVLELLEVFLAIKTFSKGKDSLNILIRADNMTAKAYINHRGGTHLQTLNSIATHLWKWSLDHQIHLTAEYLPGLENKIVD